MTPIHIFVMAVMTANGLVLEKTPVAKCPEKAPVIEMMEKAKKDGHITAWQATCITVTPQGAPDADPDSSKDIPTIDPDKNSPEL